jgi:hypothetical protein
MYIVFALCSFLRFRILKSWIKTPNAFVGSHWEGRQGKLRCTVPVLVLSCTGLNKGSIAALLQC